MAIDFEDQGAYDRAVARGFVTPTTARVRAPAAEPIGGGSPSAQYNNLDANGNFQLPSIDATDPGGARRRFSAVPTQAQNPVTPDYITDKSLHAPQDPKVVAPAARRGAPTVSSEGGYGFSAPSLGNPDDRERQKALSNIDSAMFGLGSLNMRSKRELFGQMLGLKTGLTEKAFDADNERVIARAGIAARVAERNAELAEAGARRRSDDSQFNVETGERRSMFETERQDARDAAAAAAPMNALKYAELAQRIKANDATASREQMRFDAEYPGIEGKADRDAIDNLIKNNPGMTYDAARTRYLDEVISAGGNPRRSESLAAQYNADLADQEGRLNRTGVEEWIRAGAAADGYIPFTRQAPNPGTLENETQLETEKLPIYSPLRLFTSQNNKVTARDDDGNEYTDYVTDEEADRLNRRKAALRRGSSY